MGVDWTWLGLDESDGVLVFWTDKRGAYPGADATLEGEGAEDAELRALLRLDLDFREQPARHLSHPMEGEPDLYVLDGGLGTLKLADLPARWRREAQRWRIRLGDAKEIQLRDHVPLDDLTAYSWGEGEGIHPKDRAAWEAIPAIPGWPREKADERIYGLYTAILFQAIVCNAGGDAVPIDLPGGPTPPLPVPATPPDRLDWRPILPAAGPLQNVLWAHKHRKGRFAALRPSDLTGPHLFEKGAFAVGYGCDARQILMLQKELRLALSDHAWSGYVDFLASLFDRAPSLANVRQWVLTWKQQSPWIASSTMNDPFAGGGRVRMGPRSR